MELFNKITIAHFIWYLVPGLALIFFILFPFLILNPHLTKYIFTNLGPIGVILLSIILGFALDGLRLYRLRPGYNNIKQSFFNSLIKVLDVNGLDPYFVQSHVTDVAKQKKVTGIGIHHAIWIMHGHLAMISLLECILWVLVSAYFLHYGSGAYPILIITQSKCVAIGTYIFFVVLFLLISIRFHLISTEDQVVTNNMFLNFAQQHKDEIRKLLNAKSNE